jgi:hypothetical protein
VIPPPINEANRHAIRDSTSDITEDAEVGVRQSDTDVYIVEDSIQDSKYIAWEISNMLKWRTHISEK